MSQYRSAAGVRFHHTLAISPYTDNKMMAKGLKSKCKSAHFRGFVILLFCCCVWIIMNPTFKQLPPRNLEI